MSVTISTYNVNGIRAAERKGFMQWLEETRPEIVCLQEIKADTTQVPETILNSGYYSYFHPAQKKGYSGVGILSLKKPLTVKEGMGTDWIDSEGRILTAEYKTSRVVTVYAPSGTTGDMRQEMKYRFLDAFMVWARQLVRDGKPTVFCGDFNIAHRAIDIHDPISNKKNSGFLPEERAWFSSFLETGFEDVFREKNRDVPHLYSWWTYRAGAKARNKGWRIDYQIGTPGLSAAALEARIEHTLDLSDHAPVTITYDLI